MSNTNGRNRRKITVEVSEDLHRKAKVKAALTGRPMADVLRTALEEWTEETEELIEQST